MFLLKGKLWVKRLIWAVAVIAIVVVITIVYFLCLRKPNYSAIFGQWLKIDDSFQKDLQKLLEKKIKNEKAIKKSYTEKLVKIEIEKQIKISENSNNIKKLVEELNALAKKEFNM